MKKMAVIYNPVAGKNAKIKAEKLIDDIRENNIDCDVFSTSFPEHADEIMFSLCCEYELICVAGGDGTIQQAINGASRKLEIEKNKTQVIALYGIGSGNDFVKTAGEKIEIMDKILKFFSGQLLGEPYYFMKKDDDVVVINSASMGMDAKIVQNHNKLNLKSIFGGFSYLIATIMTFLFYKTKKYKLYYRNKLKEEKRIVEAYIVVAANSPYYGGGMKICPRASNKKKELEICVIHKVNPFILLFTVLPGLYSGKHVNAKCVEMVFADEFKLEIIGEEDLVSYDGELFIGKGFGARKHKNDRLKLI